MDLSSEMNELRSSCTGKIHNAFTTTKLAIIGKLLQWQENLFFQEVFILSLFFLSLVLLFIYLFIKINLGGYLGSCFLGVFSALFF
jgi:hypothetical protein